MPTEQQCLKEKSLALASALFPHEQWIPTETNIWVAKSRLVEEYREPEKWEREMSQVRILTSRGSVAYFLPERLMRGKNFYAMCRSCVRRNGYRNENNQRYTGNPWNQFPFCLQTRDCFVKRPPRHIGTFCFYPAFI